MLLHSWRGSSFWITFNAPRSGKDRDRRRLSAIEESRECTVPKRRGVKRLLFTLVNSGRGLSFLLRSEEAFQQEFFLACLLIPAAMYLSGGYIELMLLIGSVLIVLIIEVLNTAIEVLTDRVGLEHNPLSGLAKDLGSLAVTLSLILWAVVWGSVLSRYWTEWI